MPPIDPPTAPTLFRSFHTNDNAIGNTPAAVAQPKKLKSHPIDILAAP